jgi:class 3 adenylate cyclase
MQDNSAEGSSDDQDVAKIEELLQRFPELVRPTQRTDERQPPSTSTVIDEEKGQLQSEIHSLKQDKVGLARRIYALQSDVEMQSAEISVLRDAVAKYANATQTLERKQRLLHLHGRVCKRAHEVLLSSDVSPDVATQIHENIFDESNPFSAFVVSIDIRRSTALMLKTKSALHFAKFITSLSDKLRQIVIDEFGVFDKFTGDGILAFFPESFSGKDAGLRAVRAAQACHQEFQRHYRQNWHAFKAIIKDTGLGIGIDYGQVQAIWIGDEFTVVGEPVVYACRLGAAKAETTLLNHPAYEKVSQDHGQTCVFRETEIDFKHEGPFVALEVVRLNEQHQPANPDWFPTPE